MNLSLYIHIPFCVKRCNYCDFNTYAGEEKSISAYLDAVRRETQFQGKNQPEGFLVHTIYIGGGTPTLISVKQVRELLDSLNSSFELQKETEISIEANPGTLTQKKLECLLENGINRLSIGVQSFQDEELKMLGRIHTVKEADEVYTSARQAGFGNINMDLIYGLPGQEMDKWQESLEHAIELNPNHLSLYSLTIEKGTLLDSQITCGSLQKPDEDLSGDMLEWAISQLEKAGFEQYEVSNWCRVDSNGKKWQSKHNKQYWLNEDYLGFGAGAHSFAAATRTANVLKIGEYIHKMQNEKILAFPNTSATAVTNPISHWEEIQETMMLGLRLTREGVAVSRFKSRFGVGMEAYFKREIDRLTQQGLVEWNEDQGNRCLKLTQKGILLGNRVFREFVGNPEVKLPA